jgi:hypothetical protein
VKHAWMLRVTKWRFKFPCVCWCAAAMCVKTALGDAQWR